MEAEPETKVLGKQSKPQAASVPQKNGAGRSAPDRLAIHRLVGRYELIHRLGHGGMATVYLGRATGKAGFEKLVAVKVIHPHLASEPEFVEMFLDEARIAARLHHPHVVEIHDLGEDDGVFFTVMEYVEGETLAALLRQLRQKEEYLPITTALQVIADACEGLAAAHDLRDPDGEPYHLVHRDISPHNLLVGLDGWVKVVDFGIMKAAGKRSSTLTGQLRGKLAYMSPEQARAKEIDHRTDVFALGAVLWELCTNRRLFQADSESATLELVSKGTVPDVRDCRAAVPDEVCEIIDRALAFDPADRFSSATEMLSAVRQAQRELSGSTHQEPRSQLAASMQRFFSQRADYIRAQVRGAAVQSSDRRRSSHLELGDVAARASSSASDVRIGAGGSAVAALPADSMLTGRPDIQTLTTSLAQAPARHWSLWLLLPLIGAVIGTAVVGWSRDSEGPRQPAPSVDPPAVVPTSTTPPPPADLAARQGPPPLANITWWINTAPDGATVIVGGEEQPGTTPMAIALTKGTDPIEVVIKKDGYEVSANKLAPLASENLFYSLKPLPADTKAKRRRPPGPGSIRARPPDSKSPPDKKAGDDRAPLEMPSFGRGDKAKPAGKPSGEPTGG